MKKFGILVLVFLLASCASERVPLGETAKESSQETITASSGWVVNTPPVFWTLKCERKSGVESNWTDIYKKDIDPSYPGGVWLVEKCADEGEQWMIALLTRTYWDPVFVRRLWPKWILQEAKTAYVGFQKLGNFYGGHSNLESILRKVSQNDASKQGFRKRNGDIISVQFYNFILATETKNYLKKQKNISYCERQGYSDQPICVADIELEYNFVENIVREKKVCTYYIDGVSESKKVLEPCITF